MIANTTQSYHDIFSARLSMCRRKRDYVQLCEDMVRQFEVIDDVDNNQWEVFSAMIGSEAYAEGLATAIKMYILKQKGIPYDLVSVVDIQIPQRHI